eukprot:TRINITY_DN21626_c0_g1_i1.p1 TRINITY_DN21626_c0_g1~~TRINITY_DN21626_c0_g1_i1.p1  ORF type:complete len:201 (-),score=14.11 TRINITY_DN21626_c0_g1_i1:150-752(-)
MDVPQPSQQQQQENDSARAVHQEAVLSTIEEPVSQTFLRELVAVGRKIRLVMFPVAQTQSELRNWDLWGPLILCLTLSIIVAVHNMREGGDIFAGIFTFVAVGAIVVTLNAKFLGGNLSFFQIVCVLGYCLFPICVLALICIFIPRIFRIIPAVVAVGWAVWASHAFFTGAVRAERKALAVYPIFLFYFFLAWVVVAGVA